jgi:hypothetical protein
VHTLAGEAARAAPADRPHLLRAVLLRYVEPREPGAEDGLSAA